MPRPVIDLTYRNQWDVVPFELQTAYRQQMTAVNVGVPESPPPVGIRQRLRNAWVWLKLVTNKGIVYIIKENLQKFGWQPAAVGNSVPQRF
uniref:Transposase n=1 Tax=Caenorhabditis tropicalis TaxID=1561998 RepID=A0A1I7T892_9PELO